MFRRSANVLRYCKSCNIKVTKLERYGSETYNNTEQMQKTMLKRHGGKTTLESKKLSKKVKATMLDKYGVEYTFQNKDLYAKFKQTMLDKYGAEYPKQSAEIQKRVLETCIARFGVDNPWKSAEVRKKIIETMYDRYGTSQVYNRYQYNGQVFDSSWELVFYIYHLEHGKKITREPFCIEYFVNKEKHLYYPDFRIGRKLFEIKGEQFIVRYKNGNVKTFCNMAGNITKTSKAKYKCLRDNNIKLITYIEMQTYFDYFYSKYTYQDIIALKV